MTVGGPIRGTAGVRRQGLQRFRHVKRIPGRRDRASTGAMSVRRPARPGLNCSGGVVALLHAVVDRPHRWGEDVGFVASGNAVTAEAILVRKASTSFVNRRHSRMESHTSLRQPVGVFSA